MDKKPVGRPKAITPEIISKLEEAFLRGATDKEACYFADIGMSTLYDYCVKNPDFSERKEHLKEAVKLRAKFNIAEEIEKGDRPLSQWYLERKGKDEGFSTRVEQTGKDGTPLMPDNSTELEEITQKLNELFQGTGKPSDGA